MHCLLVGNGSQDEVQLLLWFGALMQELPPMRFCGFGDWLENGHVALTEPIKINLGTLSLLLEAIYLFNFTFFKDRVSPSSLG